MTTKVNTFRRLFVSRTDAYPKAELKKGWLKVSEPLSDLVLQQHLLGIYSVGSYLLRPADAYARVLVFDVDQDNRELAMAIAEHCYKSFDDPHFSPLVEKTGGRGWHVWLCFDEWQPAARIRAFGLRIAAELELDANVEIYPKSASLAEGGVGTQVRLPLGKHHKTGNEGQLFYLNGEFSSLEDMRLIPSSVLPDKWEEPKSAGGSGGSLALPCYQAIEQGVDEGSRDEAMFALACRYRDLGTSPGIVLTILDQVNAHNRPPLPFEVLQEKVDSAFRGGARLGCSSPILQRFCDADHCRMRKRRKELRTWTAKELLTAEIPPLNWIVEDLFPSGLGILSGKPKLGKSWLALLLAKCITSGEPFLGHAVTQGPLLYLALEDGPSRLQGRLKALQISAEVPLQFELSFPRFGKEGGLEALTEILDYGFEGEPFVAVVIDSMAAAKSTKAEEISPEDMESVVRPLQELAQDRECLVLLVHHHRKKATGDVVWDVRGSGAIVGIADVSAGLYEEGDRFKLVTRSRDAPEVSYWMNFSGGYWRKEGTEEDLGWTTAVREVVAAARAFGFVTSTQVAELRGTSSRQAQRILKEAVDQGLLIEDTTHRPYRYTSQLPIEVGMQSELGL